MLKKIEEVVKQVKQNLKIVQYHQEIYVELKITQKEFNMGDHMYLKIKPNKSTLKLGSFQLDVVNTLRCQLELDLQLIIQPCQLH